MQRTLEDETQSTEFQEIEDSTQAHPKVNLDAEFDQLYEKMTQTANMETNVTTTIIPGYEKVETSSFQKSVEGCG